MALYSRCAAPSMLHTLNTSVVWPYYAGHMYSGTDELHEPRLSFSLLISVRDLCHEAPFVPARGSSHFC